MGENINLPFPLIPLLFINPTPPLPLIKSLQDRVALLNRILGAIINLLDPIVAYLNDLRRRKLIAEYLKDKKKEDSLKMPPPPADSIKNQFQKIEAPLKSRLEFGLYSGLAIFNGTISQSSLINNDKNLFYDINCKNPNISEVLLFNYSL